jgi:hypothetical protein
MVTSAQKEKGQPQPTLFLALIETVTASAGTLSHSILHHPHVQTTSVSMGD